MLKTYIFILTVVCTLILSGAALAADNINLSLGKKYTVIVNEPVASYEEMAIKSYPDVDGIELTDGLLAAEEASYKDANFVGYLRQGGRQIVIDLGRTANVAEVAVRFLSSPDVGISLPSEVAVSLSDDGKLWSSPVSAQIESSLFTEIITTTLKPAGSARYIKVAFPVNVWVFVDEITASGTWAN